MDGPACFFKLTPVPAGLAQLLLPLCSTENPLRYGFLITLLFSQPCHRNSPLQVRILPTRVPMALKTERRTQNRKRPLSLVYVELPPSNGGMMRDLSEQGFSLRAMMPLSPSEKVPFSFMLDTSARIDGEAIVFRVEDGGHVAALEFAGLPSHSRDQIRRWLDRFDEPFTPESAPTQPRESKHASLTELRTKIRAPKPPSLAPPVGESAPQSSKTIVPPKPEPSLAPPAPPAEIAAPPPQEAAGPNPEPPPAPVSAILETPPPPAAVVPPKPEPPLPPAAEIPQPPSSPAMMALPGLVPPLTEEAPSPPVSDLRLEQQETPSLPPLLKLSSVRPGPPPTDISVEPVVTATPEKPIDEPPAKIQISPPKPEPPATIETRVTAPVAAPPVVARRVPPPALEPLSSFEREKDSDAPGWMDRFTLGRAIGIMLFLTLFVGSYVYHREVGQALIWLGHQIAGDESPESSKVVLPGNPPASHAVPVPAPSAPAAKPEPPSPSNSQPVASMEPKSANLPAATDKTPSPQLKDTTPGSLVPLTQVARPPAPPAASPTDNATEAGQQEYLEALQILRSPSRASEVPAAVKLLWAAVEKGNTSGEIALAELFRTGKGVAKNCDQTRILLSAAARKGSAEARKRLEELRRQGCTN